MVKGIRRKKKGRKILISLNSYHSLNTVIHHLQFGIIKDQEQFRSPRSAVIDIFSLYILTEFFAEFVGETTNINIIIIIIRAFIELLPRTEHDANQMNSLRQRSTIRENRRKCWLKLPVILLV